MTEFQRPHENPSHATLGNQQTLEADLERLAHWMDSVFRIPGLGLRFGLDALLGLLPGAGDVASSVVSIYIFTAANRYGVPRITIVRMALNIAIDLIVGALPVVGDLFDAYWKSNQRNVELLRRHAGASPAAIGKLRTADRVFVGALVLLLCALVVASLVLAYLVVTWLIAVLNRVRFDPQ
jgi:hypothetical protein